MNKKTQDLIVKISIPVISSLTTYFLLKYVVGGSIDRVGDWVGRVWVETKSASNSAKNNIIDRYTGTTAYSNNQGERLYLVYHPSLPDRRVWVLGREKIPDDFLVAEIKDAY